jgi:O-acetyl-ADP-ribose deacetylase (regulator of RNase III)
MGAIPLGGAVHTTSGRLPFKAIIHIAGINMFWKASRSSIRNSVINSIKLAEKLGMESLAMPIIGAGSGSFRRESAERIIVESLEELDSDVRVVVVRYRR